MTSIKKKYQLLRPLLMIFALFVFYEIFEVSFRLSCYYTKPFYDNYLICALLGFYSIIIIISLIGYVMFKVHWKNENSKIYLFISISFILLGPFIIVKNIGNLVAIPSCTAFTFTDIQILVLACNSILFLMSCFFLYKIWKYFTLTEKTAFIIYIAIYLILDATIFHKFHFPLELFLKY
jgi:hypothetical protein